MTSFCLTQLNAQIVPAEVATSAALVQPAALQGDVEGVGHLMECVRLIIIAWVVQTVAVLGNRRLSVTAALSGSDTGLPSPPFSQWPSTLNRHFYTYHTHINCQYAFWPSTRPQYFSTPPRHL